MRFLPYLLEAVRGFGSILQKQWDHFLQSAPIKLILSGSYVSAMTRLTAADQPLHGRRTSRIHVRPFDYLGAAAFVPRYSPVDKLLTYAIFGGLPGQLAVIDPDRSLAENVSEHLLDPSGRLADEGEHILDAFVRDGGVHYSILRAIAQGEHRWQKITSRIGKNSASVSRPLDWLQDMGIVTRVIPATDNPPGSPKRALYRLTDPYLVFWHRLVAPLRAAGTVDLLAPAQLWTRHVATRLPEHMGAMFEAVCRSFVASGAHPRLPFAPDRVGEWWTNDSAHQVDVVSLGPDGQVLLGECKWGPVSHHDLRLLKQRRDLITRELRGTRSIQLALFTAEAVRDEPLLESIRNGEALVFTPEDLLSPT
ncbi:MAG: ATP-binding protein [Steroidobacteraceae bacterium]